jgi:hypothetical protein
MLDPAFTVAPLINPVPFIVKLIGVPTRPVLGVMLLIVGVPTTLKVCWAAMASMPPSPFGK